MTRTEKSINAPKIALALTTALASVALAGCTTGGSAPRAETSFSKAQSALAKGEADKAVMHAEAAVQSEPRNASYRAMLGAAYLESGRFQAAATSFSDALDLGDTDPRTVLSYALAETALGNSGAARAALNENAAMIDGADLGLALALAGDADRGVEILGNQLREGQNSAKLRQNLAYAYALQGNWRGARVMAAEDVPADQLDERISQWAQMGKPEDYQTRVATLLNVTPTYDAGQPTYLALSNHPAHAEMVAEAAAEMPVELAAADEASFAEAPVATPAAPVAAPAAEAAPMRMADAAPAKIRYVSNPVIQQINSDYQERRASAKKRPATRLAASSSQRRMASTADNATDTHLVQLGSFSSREGAENAWSIYKKRYPNLKGHDMVITQANVGGKTYYRVAAAGFGKNGAAAMCGQVKASGAGCLAYASSTSLPGATDKVIRVAAR
ncbi:SPOR domain-containing protein [Altererythrobacter lutimaris]|uniref:SPOR domain-containing protein n=1 Tax=Altererythrobacter lutimaris TaxID=2743979 RepID=A0A850HAR8_9SPHN|nr:SPOR domain-containing protein [Altererythrobacter lutimaris]NVE94829.1 SPOR domain-containing protein [Altererythrobacter lutimaris]